MPDAEIRNKYRGLWEIEESFKIMKSEFKARPVYVKTDEHVNAHFLTCYVALVIMRVIERLLKEKYTVNQIRNALCNYSCSYVDQGYYMFDYRDEVTDAFGNLFGWDLSQKYMPLALIKNILSHQKSEIIQHFISKSRTPVALFCKASRVLLSSLTVKLRLDFNNFVTIFLYIPGDHTAGTEDRVPC